MAFAPHTNDQVTAHNGLTLILGCFRERDHGNFFEYAIRPEDGLDFAADCPHIVFTADGYRYAKVLKTVAWIAVGERPDGSASYERWEIKDHRNYDTTPYRNAA